MKGEESEIWLLQRRARRGPPASRDRGPCLSMAIWRTERTHKALPGRPAPAPPGRALWVLSGGAGAGLPFAECLTVYQLLYKHYLQHNTTARKDTEALKIYPRNLPKGPT